MIFNFEVNDITIHINHRERLRKRFTAEGLDSFEEHEALELLLFYALPQKDTNPIAHELLNQFGSLANVFDAEISDLISVDGIGEYSATLLHLVFEMSRKYWISRKKPDFKITSIASAAEYANVLLRGKSFENFYVICLDAQFHVKHTELLSRGTSTQAPVYIRHITESVIRSGTEKVLIAHNHPGGNAHPSKQDIDVTTKILQAMNALDIEFIDHIIVSDDDYFSFAETMLPKDHYSKEQARAAQYSGGVMQNFFASKLL
ncbi:MAG: DNA repair protein RadC [Christensenellaceae bacterium]